MTEEFRNAYIEALFFTNAGDSQDELTADHDSSDFAYETEMQIWNDCHYFELLCKKQLNQLPDNYSLAQAGHDFWLTRNGHGTGFWDRDLGDLGDKLTEFAVLFGECSPYLADDGKIYLM